MFLHKSCKARKCEPITQERMSCPFTARSRTWQNTGSQQPKTCTQVDMSWHIIYWLHTTIIIFSLKGEGESRIGGEQFLMLIKLNGSLNKLPNKHVLAIYFLLLTSSNIPWKQGCVLIRKYLHPAGKINQYTPPRVCVTPPSFAWTWIPSTCMFSKKEY